MNPWFPRLLAFGLSLVGAGGLLAQGGGAPAPDLFERTASTVVRVRHETLASPPGLPVRLNVQPGVVYEGRVTGTAATAFGSRVVRGTVPGAPGGAFLAVEHGTATAAAVWISPTERYALDGAAIRVLRGPAKALCAHAADLPTVASRSSDAPRPRAVAATALRRTNDAAVPASLLSFDVLVVYTPAAMAVEGGSADAIAAQAELAMADANICYENSGIPITGRIVGVQPVDYVESGEIRTDLHRLAVAGDGFLDEVQGLRDAAEADFVCLFTNHVSADGYQGYAEILTALKPNYEELAYSVVNVKSVAIEHLFAHELGHNMGCDHDRENTTGLRLFDFSYGWRFTGSDGKLYRDVMAYAPGASVPYFANPLVSYLGTPTGVADYADTARTITASAPTFVNFRASDGLARVSLRAAVGQASVAATGGDRAAFQFERTGSIAGDLTIAYQAGGTAVGGGQYETLPGSLTFPAGRHFANLKVTGLPNGTPFGLATLTLTLQPGAAYVVADDPPTGAGPAATVTLLDQTPLISLGTAALSKNGAKIKAPVSRLGPTNGALTVAYTLGGTARAGVDYETPAGTVAFAAGESSATVKIKLVPGSGGSGLTVTMQLAPGQLYQVGAASTADFVLP